MVTERRRSERMMLAIIALILVGFVLYVTRSVAVLVAIAAFLAILLYPAMVLLQRFLPRWLALVVVFAGIALLLTGVGLAFFAQGKSVADKAPEYAQRFNDLIQGLLVFARDDLGIQVAPSDLGTGDALSGAISFVASGLGSVMSMAAQGLLVLIMVLFMLIEAPMFKRKIGHLLDAESGERVSASMGTATSKVQRYLITKTLVSLTTGVLTYVICVIIGVDFPFVWGALAFQLNFIPYVGSIIAVIPPTLVGFLQTGDYTMGLAILLTLGSLQFSIGNLIEPRIMGRTLALSPLVVFISMLFWGFFWGAIGVILSVPLTAIIQIVCLHSENLRPVALLLGDGRDIDELEAELDLEPSAEAALPAEETEA